MPQVNARARTYPDVLRKAGYHQTNNGLLWVPPTMRQGYPNTSPTTLINQSGAKIVGYEIQNRSGGAIAMGFGFRIANRHWMAGRYDGTTYTDVTATLQSTATTTIGVDGADQTGLVFLCPFQFDWVSVNITTAEVDAGAAVPDHTVSYSNLAGTGWTTANATTQPFTDTFTLTNTVLTAAVKNFVWYPPIDWGPTNGMTGLLDGYYALYITTADKEAGDTAPIATGAEIGLIHAIEAVDDSKVYADDRMRWHSPYADGVVGYFGTANAGNTVYVEAYPWG